MSFVFGLTQEQCFLLLLLINLIIAVLYLVIGTVVVSPAQTRKAREENSEILHDKRRTYLLRFVIMILCPIVAPVFFLFSYLLSKSPIWMQVNLDDVTFSKERVKVQMKADENRDRDILPLEEAVFVNENKDLRVVMLNTLRGNVHDSLGSIMVALNSRDSEVAHYAASILSNELNDFRANAQKMYNAIKEETEEQTECEINLIEYMDDVLKQGIITSFENKKLVSMMEKAGESLYSKDATQITYKHYESIILRLIEVQDYAKAEVWSTRLAEQYPSSLSAYSCKLKLYFSTKDRKSFFETLKALKESNIVIDNETLELIRVFS